MSASMRRTVLLIGTGLVVVAALAVWRSSSRVGPVPRTPVPVRLGFRPTVVVDLAILLAIDGGKFRSAGLDVTLHPYGRADLLISALDSGQIDGSLGIPLEPLLATAAKGSYPYKGFGVWYFDQTTPYDGFVVAADSPLKTVEDIRGAIVGSHPSRQVKYFVTKMVPTATVQEYNPASPLLSLAAGDQASAYVLEPAISQALEGGRYRLLESGSISRRLFGGQRVPAALSILSERWVQASPDASRTFLRVASDAYKEFSLASSRDAVVDLLTRRQYGGFSKAVASRVVEPAFSLPDNFDKLGFDRFQEELLKGGLLSTPINSSKLLVSAVK